MMGYDGPMGMRRAMMFGGGTPQGFDPRQMSQMPEQGGGGDPQQINRGGLPQRPQMGMGGYGGMMNPMIMRQMMMGGPMGGYGGGGYGGGYGGYGQQMGGMNQGGGWNDIIGRFMLQKMMMQPHMQPQSQLIQGR